MPTQQYEKLISVVLPVYNAEDFLDETIASVLNQTYTDFEFIIVNHSSTDTSKEIIDSYAKNDNRIVVKNLDINKGGPAYPRNEGVKYAQGKFISFIDSDDVWKNNKLESIVESCLNYDIIYHSEIHFKGRIENGRKVLSDDIKSINDLFKQLLFHGNLFSPSAITISREILLSNQFDEDINVQGVEDFDLWLRLARQNYKYKYINDFLGYYRLHDKAFSENSILQSSRERKLLKKYFKQHKIKIFHSYKRLFRSIASSVYYELKKKQKLNIKFYLKEVYDIFKY